MANEKPKGWFSRKHQDSGAHADAVKKYQESRGKLSRREKAEARTAARSERTIEGQLRLLDARLGPGVGATKERARLAALANPEKKEN